MPTQAQRLRKNPTPAEIRLWRLIEPLRTGSYHFRKQVAIGPYIVDFACHHAKLVIEVDGDTHFTGDAISADERRDAFLAGRGYRVLHFTNDDVMRNGEGVYTTISNTLAAEPDNVQ